MIHMLRFAECPSRRRFPALFYFACWTRIIETNQIVMTSVLKRLLEHNMGHKLNTLKPELRRRHTRVNQLPNQIGWASMHLLPPWHHPHVAAKAMLVPRPSAACACNFHSARTTCTSIVYLLLLVFSSSSKRQRSPSCSLLSWANCLHPCASLLHPRLPFWIRHCTSQLSPQRWSVSVRSSNGRYTSAYALGMACRLQ